MPEPRARNKKDADAHDTTRVVSSCLDFLGTRRPHSDRSRAWLPTPLFILTLASNRHSKGRALNMETPVPPAPQFKVPINITRHCGANLTPGKPRATNQGPAKGASATVNTDTAEYSLPLIKQSTSIANCEYQPSEQVTQLQRS